MENIDYKICLECENYVPCRDRQCSNFMCNIDKRCFHGEINREDWQNKITRYHENSI